MNTGDAQELALYEVIKRELRKKRFGLIPECCQVYHHRAYFSQDRAANIIFDIAVEVYILNAVQPFFIWVWESKNYSTPLSVDNVEEFHAKLQQIGADKTKGTIVLSGEIQKSALAYAISKGIGIAKFLPSERIKWLHFCKEDIPLDVERQHFSDETMRSMIDPEFCAVNRGFFAYTSEGTPFRGDFEHFLRQGFLDVSKQDVWRNDLGGLNWRELPPPQ